MLNIIKNLLGLKEPKVLEVEETCQSEKEKEEIVRKEALYSGKVQGVGFRFEAYSVANKNNLTGLVKNLDNGDVYLEVQGEMSVVDAFIDFMKNLDRADVTKVDIKNIKVKDFEISFKIEN